MYDNQQCLVQCNGKEEKDLDIYRMVLPERIVLICLLFSGVDTFL
jgi:hypothetical protein